MITLKIGGIIVAAFVAGAFVASPELRAYAANTVDSLDIIDGQVKTVDLGNNAVTSVKIKDGEVKAADLGGGAVNSAKIADGTIKYADLSRSFVKMEHRDDCNCGGTGWDPDGVSEIIQVHDNAATPNSAILVNLVGFTGMMVCSASTARPTDTGYFFFQCDSSIPNNVGLNYVIFNKK